MASYVSYRPTLSLPYFLDLSEKYSISEEKKAVSSRSSRFSSQSDTKTSFPDICGTIKREISILTTVSLDKIYFYYF